MQPISKSAGWSYQCNRCGHVWSASNYQTTLCPNCYVHSSWIEKPKIKKQLDMGKKKKKKKMDEKTYLFVYPDETVVVQRLTMKEIKNTIKTLELEIDEYSIIDGELVQNV